MAGGTSGGVIINNINFIIKQLNDCYVLETDAKDVASNRAKRTAPDNWRALRNIQ